MIKLGNTYKIEFANDPFGQTNILAVNICSVSFDFEFNMITAYSYCGWFGLVDQ